MLAADKLGAPLRPQALIKMGCETACNANALARHEPERTIDRPQHPVKLMPTPHDQPCRGNHAVDPLPQGERRIFLNAVYRHLRGPAKYRKHRPVPQEVDGVVSPLAFCDLASIKTDYAAEFAPIEGDLSGGLGGGVGGAKRTSTPTLAAWRLAWIDFARTQRHGRLLFIVVS